MSSNIANDAFGAISGSNKQARIAQRGAEAEQAARVAVTNEARASRDRMNLIAQSPQQLAALDRGYAAAQTQVDADLRQLAAIDPAIMEASKQVLTLLQGGQAAVNNPAMQQRQTQRQQLVDSLKSQYGPGAESTSHGQRALQQFDQQSATMFQQNQQNTLGNMMGIATTRTQGAGFGQLMSAAGGYNNYSQGLLGAEQAGSNMVLQGMSGEVQGAAAPFVGDMLRANFQRQKYNDVSGDMRQMGRAWGSMGKSGGSNPSQKSGGEGGGFGGNSMSYGGDMSSGSGDMGAMSNGGSFGQRGM